MSRQGDCWDNACSETLFGSLKVERLHGLHLKLFGQPKMKCSIGCSVITNTTSFDTQLRQPDAVRTELGARHGALCKFNGGCEVEKANGKVGKRKAAFQLSHSHDYYEIHSVMGYGFKGQSSIGLFSRRKRSRCSDDSVHPDFEEWRTERAHPVECPRPKPHRSPAPCIGHQPIKPRSFPFVPLIVGRCTRPRSGSREQPPRGEGRRVGWRHSGRRWKPGINGNSLH